MLIFVYGADTFRSRRKLHELIEAFAAKHDEFGVNVTRLDGVNLNLDVLSGDVRSQPFFAVGKRLVVIERLLQRKNLAVENLIEILGSVPESTVLLVWDELTSETAAKHAVLKKFAKAKEATSYAFAPLSGPSLTKWVRDEAVLLGGGIAPRAVEHLLGHAGADLWRLHTEIEKLVAFRAGETIRPEDVELLTEGSVEENIFAVMDALSEKDTAAASRLIRQEIATGVEESYLVAMLLRQIRILTQVRSFISQSPRASREEIGKALGLHPYVVQKASGAAQNFAPGLLVGLLNSLFESDHKIKRGQIAPGLAIERLLAVVAAG